MRIGLDLDGCMYPFLATYRRWRQVAYGLDLAAPSGWIIEGITQQQFNRECREATDARFLFVEGDPLPGARAVVQDLADRGHVLNIVTARSKAQFGPRTESNTRDWLRRWDIPFHDLHFSHDKASVPNDIFVDDNLDNVDRLMAAGIEAWLLYDPPREDQLGHPRFIGSWEEFRDKVDALDNLRAA